jgi:hypothetical protein
MHHRATLLPIFSLQSIRSCAAGNRTTIELSSLFDSMAPGLIM